MARRGRPATYEEIVHELRGYGELDWHKTFVVFKKASIKGETLRGCCYKKIIARPTEPIGRSLSARWGAYELKTVYATHKEVFQDKLRHNDES